MSKYLDTRDLAKRKEELEGYKTALEEARAALDEAGIPHDARFSEHPKAVHALIEAEEAALCDFGTDEAEELDELETLESEISEWRHGGTLIPVDDFEEYARQFAEDIGAMPDDSQWPCTCINWEKAADELAQDYSEVTYQGTDYYVRA